VERGQGRLDKNDSANKRGFAALQAVQKMSPGDVLAFLTRFA